MVNSIYYENMPSFCTVNDRYVMRIVRAMRVQTCAFSRAVLMAGTIAAVQRLSAENHLGLPDGTILIVLSRNVATCTIEPAVQSTLRHDAENHRPGYSTFHKAISNRYPLQLLQLSFLVSLTRCTDTTAAKLLEHYCNSTV